MSECKKCIHYPICEWCAENTEFKFPEDNKKCAMWHTADVVPREDYERVINACKDCREDDIVKAKWEGAREIFAELKTLIDEYLDGLYNTAEFIDIFRNLEKKFVEEK